MKTLIEKNKAFIRKVFDGQADRHGFVCQPSQIPLYERGDYTLSDRPVKEWVPFVAENFRRKAEMLETLQDDSVPVASLMTGTHLFAQAFGCEVHTY